MVTAAMAQVPNPVDLSGLSTPQREVARGRLGVADNETVGYGYGSVIGSFLFLAEEIQPGDGNAAEDQHSLREPSRTSLRLFGRCAEIPFIHVAVGPRPSGL